MRDVERAMNVITWFYTNSELISSVVGCLSSEDEDESSSEDSGDEIVLEAKDEKDKVYSEQITWRLNIHGLISLPWVYRNFNPNAWV